MFRILCKNQKQKLFIYNAAFPAVYGQFPQALPPPLAAVAPTQREGKLFIIIFRLFSLVPSWTLCLSLSLSLSIYLSSLVL